MAGPCSKIKNPVAAAKQASVDPREIEELKESRVNDMSSEELSDSESEEEEDLETLYKKEAAKYRSAAAKREFFSGMRF